MEKSQTPRCPNGDFDSGHPWQASRILCIYITDPWLSLQARPALVINEPFMHGAKPSAAEEILRREVAGDHPQLRQTKHMKTRTYDRIGGQITGR
nr:hypothetical protein Iba_chr09dCG7090 [Ipomoea batatas]